MAVTEVHSRIFSQQNILTEESSHRMLCECIVYKTDFKIKNANISENLYLFFIFSIFCYILKILLYFPGSSSNCQNSESIFELYILPFKC